MNTNLTGGYLFPVIGKLFLLAVAINHCGIYNKENTLLQTAKIHPTINIYTSVSNVNDELNCVYTVKNGILMI